jgi:lipopolysaccharide/colanic/teichoic acid biosynthesis glycosyltransferase
MPGFDLKRPFDAAVSAVALVLLSPVMAATALAVRIALGSPVIFRQVRPGLHAKPFELVKFRTMLPYHDRSGRLLGEAERLTRFGRFLRSTSLDELPQLWNVLKGDMSLVGPRPLLMDYLPHYTPEQAKRHEVRPGVTGWAAVKGRNALGWPEKLALDTWYVENRSFLLDLRILVLTVISVVSRRGIAADSSGVTPPMVELAPPPAPGGETPPGGG